MYLKIIGLQESVVISLLKLFLYFTLNGFHPRLLVHCFHSALSSLLNGKQLPSCNFYICKVLAKRSAHAINTTFEGFLEKIKWLHSSSECRHPTDIMEAKYSRYGMIFQLKLTSS